MPRLLVHALLSLLLLATQQMALLHASTHWSQLRETERAQVFAEQNRSSDTAPAKSAAHALCALCLDSAQLALALPALPHVFLLLALDYDSPTGPFTAGVMLLKAHAFHARGPPQA